MRLGQISAITFLSRFGSSILGFLATVYFARVLGSDVLGVYFLTLATVAWLKLGCSVGIPLAVTKRVSERNDSESHVIAGLLLTTIGFLIVSVAVYLLRDYVNQYLGGQLYHFVVLLLGAQVAFSFVGAVIKGEHLVHVEGILGVSQTVVRVVLQVVAVYAGFRVSGLLFGEFVAFAVIAVVGVVLLVTRFDRSIPVTVPEREHFWSIVDFAKYSVLGNLKGRSFNLMDTIVLGFFVPSGLIGIYGICWNVSSVLDIFAKSLSTSLFPEMSKLSSDDADRRVARYLSDALAFAGLFIIPGFVGAVVIGEGILNLFGSEFRQGYVVLVILVAAILFHSYHKQFVNTMDAVNRPELSFRVNAFFVVTNVGMNFVLVYLYGWTGAAVATLLSVFASMLLAYRMMDNLLEFSIPFGEISRQVFSALVMGGIVYAGTQLLRSAGVDTQRIVPVLAAVGLGVVVYFGCLMAVSPRFRTTVSDNLPVDVPI